MKLSSFFWGLSLFLLSGFVSKQAQAQRIVEVSGVVTTKNTQGRTEFVPFVNVLVEGVKRGTYANYEGMFSIVVRPGQKLRFTAIGYEDRLVEIPEYLSEDNYPIIVELQAKAYDLGEVVVFPWPDRDNFRAEFLAMSPNQALQMEAVARKNLDERTMLSIREATRMDSRENATYLMRKQARDYSYTGQIPPMRIFDPLAWGQFFQSISGKKKKQDRPIEFWEDGE